MKILYHSAADLELFFQIEQSWDEDFEGQDIVVLDDQVFFFILPNLQISSVRI